MKRWNLDLNTNNHSVFSLHYHLILVVKYRREVITDEISARLKEIFERVGAGHGIRVLEWNHDRDHVHVLFRSEPSSTLSKFLNAYKSASSRLIKKEYPEIRKKLWKEYFWSKSYCLISSGGAPLKILKQYIESQGERSRRRDDDGNSHQIPNIPH